MVKRAANRASMKPFVRIPVISVPLSLPLYVEAYYALPDTQLTVNSKGWTMAALRVTCIKPPQVCFHLLFAVALSSWS